MLRWPVERFAVGRSVPVGSVRLGLLVEHAELAPARLQDISEERTPLHVAPFL